MNYSAVTNVLHDITLVQLLGLAIASICVCLIGQLASGFSMKRSAAFRCTIWQLTGASILLSTIWLFCIPGIPFAQDVASEANSVHSVFAETTTPTSKLASPSAKSTWAPSNFNSMDRDSSLIDSLWRRISEPRVMSITAQIITFATALFAVIWIGVAIVLCFALRKSFQRASKILTADSLPTANAVVNAFTVAVQQMDNRSLANVRLRVVDGVTVPLTIGLWRPTIVLPTHCTDWPRHKLVMILIHELAHVERRDIAWHLIVRSACCLAWFNPLVWRVEKMMVKEREHACDDRVLLSGMSPADYGQAIVEIVQSLKVPFLATSGLASIAEPPIQQRLRNILADQASRKPVHRRTWCALMIAFLSVSLATSSLRPFAKPIIAQTTGVEQHEPSLAIDTTQLNDASREFDALLKKEAELTAAYVEESPTSWEDQMQLDPRNLMAADYLEFEERHRGDELAFEAIAKIMHGASTLMHLTETKASRTQDAAIEVLIQHYLDHKQLPRVFNQDLRLDDRFLQLASDRSPYESVRARAILTLVFKARERIRIAGFPSLEANFADPRFNQGPHMRMILRMRELDVPREKARVHQMLEILATRYRSTTHPQVGTYGHVADCIHTAMENIAVGKPAQELVAQDVKGNEFRLSALRGKFVAITFTQDLQGDAANIENQAVAKKFRNSGIEFVAVVAVDDLQKFSVMVAKSDLLGTVLPQAIDSQAIRMSWDIRWYPQTYLIDANGIILRITEPNEHMESSIKSLL